MVIESQRRKKDLQIFEFPVIRIQKLSFPNFCVQWVKVFITVLNFFICLRTPILGLVLNKNTLCLTKMVILLAGQRVGSLGHRDPTTVLLVLEMCLDVTWLKLTIVLACMQVSKLQEQMRKLCQLRWELSNIDCNNFQSSENSRHFREAGHYLFPHQKTSVERAQKFHTDDASLPRSG